MRVGRERDGHPRLCAEFNLFIFSSCCRLDITVQRDSLVELMSEHPLDKTRPRPRRRMSDRQSSPICTEAWPVLITSLLNNFNKGEAMCGTKDKGFISTLCKLQTHQEPSAMKELGFLIPPYSNRKILYLWIGRPPTCNLGIRLLCSAGLSNQERLSVL